MNSFVRRIEETDVTETVIGSRPQADGGTAQAPMLFEAADFSVRTGQTPILERVTLSIRKGEVLGIVGESGAGKSTLGKCIARALPRQFTTAGRLDVFGEDIGQMPASRHRALMGDRIAFVPQEPTSALNPVRRIGSLFGEHLTRLGVPKAEQQARMVAALSEVMLPDPEAVLNRYAFQLSGGMNQRIMIAMAFASRPDLVISDEATTALDMITQERTIVTLNDMRARYGCGVLFITHDLRLAGHFCDRVAVLRNGVVVEEGPAAQVLEAPQHPYSQGLKAATPRLDGPPHPLAAPSPKLRIPAQPAPIMAARGLAVRYGDPKSAGGQVEIMRDVDLQVEVAEFVGLIGRSGSGKSTIARILAGLQQPTEGDILLDGRVLGNSASDWQDRIASAQMVFQDPSSALNPRRRVWDIVTQAMVARGERLKSDRRRRAAELLADVGLDERLLDAYPRQMSGGQRQRVNIARALCVMPRLLIADEIVSGLDVSVQAQVIYLLLELRQRHDIALLMVSHDLSVLRQLCDRVVVMDQGAIVEAGPTQQVLDAPQHEATRALIAAAPPDDLSKTWPRGTEWDSNDKTPE
ncbi:ABC transporter ATP-binding protein [Thalassovita mangrovi]|uniref:Nickel ABC transporter ATP-binding protein NikE n=1 Tax=Thalassovita mangrovi TaxID=2692236 RepID=A0A6L8LKF9_9RHOB|nr:ABC transporter ATP-binding protein [Thalassovita mangrovi]MYM56345.1 nickel ABC transporter ATP-binding protein NikE [Thalassovita mangrovi]